MFKKFSKSKIFYAMLVAFIFGIGLASFQIKFVLWAIIVLFCVLFIFIKKRLAIILIILSLIGGYYWMIYSVPKDNDQNIHYYNEQKTNFTGFITEEVDLRSDHQKLTIEVENIEEQKAKGRVLVKTELFPPYEYGQQLQIECFLRQPGMIDDFDYAQYLSRYDIYSTCYNPKVKILDKSQGSLIKKYLFKAKFYFLSRINKILPEPHSSFMAGLLLGVRKGIPPDIMEAFNRTGVTHIIAVSGYNITIVAVALMNLFKSVSISRKKSFYFACAGIIAFVFLCGASAAVVRAAIMGIIALFAKQVGRKTNMIYVLILAVFIMTLINPKILIFDLGFQLSFLATVGLIYLSKSLENFFSWLPEVFGLRENFSTTLAAIISTTPLIMYNFSRVSLIAPLANILILSAIPIAMLLGFIGVVLALFSIALAQIFSWITWLVLEYIIKVIEILSKIEWASVNVGFGLGWAIFCYVIILFFIYLCNNSKKQRLKITHLKG